MKNSDDKRPAKDKEEFDYDVDNELVEETGKVQVFHRINRLKVKAGSTPDGGPVKLDPDKIKRAETVIQTKSELYPDEIKAVLTKLLKSWTLALKTEGEGRDSALEDLYHTSNQVKDLAATFGYTLMQHFGRSLRGFIENLDINNKAHQTIVKAHIDVMFVVLHENIKDEGGEQAKELKNIVAKAIDKHSKKT